MRILVGLLCVLPITVFTGDRVLGSAAVCADVAKLALPNVKVTLTEVVEASGVVPAYCRVAATLTPTSDSDIKIEVWLPATGWNGKFQAVGNGAFSGAIASAALRTALTRGYAAGSTDTGHTGGSASFALGHPEKVIDFGWRAVHEMTVTAKKIVGAYYDAPLKFFLVLERLLRRRTAGDERSAALPR